MQIIKMLSTTNVTLNANNPQYIIIHETDNTSRGAGAKTHCKAQANGNIGKASVHYYVDDTGVYQAVEHKHSTWNCGDGNNRYGINNKNTISIEICVNHDSNYNVAIDKTIELVRYLKSGYYSNCKVVRHYDASRKKCPRRILDNGYWNTFLERVNSKESSSNPSENNNSSQGNGSNEGFYESNEKRTNATVVGQGNIPVLNKLGQQISNRYISSLDNVFVLGIYPSSKVIELVYPSSDKKYHAYIDIKYYNRLSFEHHMKYLNDGGSTYVWWNSNDVDKEKHDEELKPYQKASPMYRENRRLRVTFYRDNGIPSDGYLRYEGIQDEKFYKEPAEQYGVVTGISSYLNVRNSPNGSIIGKVFPNEKVLIKWTESGYYYIEYNTLNGSKQGYASAKYINKI